MEKGQSTDQPLMATVRNKTDYIEIMNVYQDRPEDMDNDFVTGRIHPLAFYEKKILEIIRMDQQLYFFWSFILTILAVFCKPFIIAGLLVTVTKQFFDVAALKGWRWGNFIWGMAGFITAVLFIYKTSFGG